MKILDTLGWIGGALLLYASLQLSGVSDEEGSEFSEENEEIEFLLSTQTSGSGGYGSSSGGIGAVEGTIPEGVPQNYKDILPPTYNAQNALHKARVDDADKGLCARGVANVLATQGYPGFRGYDAKDMPIILQKKGWVRTNLHPTAAPPLSVQTYASDPQMGKKPRNDKGGKWGHADVKIVTSEGKVYYVSDAARPNWGGSVKDNFTGTWIPPEMAQAMKERGLLKDENILPPM